jgi:hypothetical protein
MPHPDRTRLRAPDARARARYFDVLGHRVYVQHKPPKTPQPLSMCVVIAWLGLAFVLFHEVLYRQTDEAEFPILGVMSHAGFDLALQIVYLIGGLLIVRRVADRGVR